MARGSAGGGKKPKKDVHLPAGAGGGVEKRTGRKVITKKREPAGDGSRSAPSNGLSKRKQRGSRGAAAPAIFGADRESSPPVEQPHAKQRKLGAPSTRQLEVGRVLVCLDSNILMGHAEEAEQAWAAIEAGGGARVQALVPLKVRHEVRSLAGSAGRRNGQFSTAALRATRAARGASALLDRMMPVVDCCRVQREDEQFRRHPHAVLNQRGDDSILDSLLHFHALGAQVLLATADRQLAERASEHGLQCVGPKQLAGAVHAALAAGQWTAEHDRELALLLFAPGYQQAALAASFLPHSEDAYGAFARRLQQPLQRVLLAATQLLAGSPAVAAAAACCWDAASARRPTLAVEQRAPPAALRSGVGAQPSSGSFQLGGGRDDSDAESTGTPEPTDGTASAADAEEKAEPAAGPAGPAVNNAELLRLKEEPGYREQVCGTRKHMMATVAEHFGMSKQQVAAAIQEAIQARKLDSMKRKAAQWIQEQARAPRPRRYLGAAQRDGDGWGHDQGWRQEGEEGGYEAPQEWWEEGGGGEPPQEWEEEEEQHPQQWEQQQQQQHPQELGRVDEEERPTSLGQRQRRELQRLEELVDEVQPQGGGKRKKQKAGKGKGKGAKARSL